MTKSRNKGASGERELSQELNRLFPNISVRRGCQFKGTHDSPDVVGLPGIHPECKRVEKGLNLEDALKKADKEKHESQISAVFHRRNRERWKVTVFLDDLAAFSQKVISLS